MTKHSLSGGSSISSASWSNDCLAVHLDHHLRCPRLHHDLHLMSNTTRAGGRIAKDLSDGVMRLLCHEFYLDADIEEIAEAAETTTWVVKTVLKDKSIRLVMQHATLVSERLGLDLEDSPVAVITLALEELVANG